MSVILALLGRKCAVVASDSIFSPPGGPATYNCDKTFRVQTPLTLGSHCGLLDFGKGQISLYASAIIAESKLKRLQEVSSEVANKIAAGLNSSQIFFQQRKVELLIAGRKKFTSGRWEIRTVQIEPNFATKQLDLKTDLFRGQGAIAHAGDVKARDAVQKFLADKQLSEMDRKKLVEVATQALKHGIKHCGPHPTLANTPACGGPVCVQAI
jgi:hypothetical protein